MREKAGLLEETEVWERGGFLGKLVVLVRLFILLMDSVCFVGRG